MKKIEHFLLSNTVWMFFTAILLLSYIMMAEAGKYSWSLYGGYTLSVSVLFAPVLAFSGFRRWLKEHLGRMLYNMLWLFCFVALPLLLAWGSFNLFEKLPLMPGDYESGPGPGGQIVRSVGIALLLVEMMIQLNGYLRKQFYSRQWLKRLSLERTILSVLLLIAVLGIISNNLLMENTGLLKSRTILQFISYTIQLFLILLGYYFFYFVNHYFLINKLLRQKGILYYLFGLAATILLFYPIISQLTTFLPIFDQENGGHGSKDSVFQEDTYAVIPMMIMLLSIPMILAIQWFKQSSEIANLEKEKTATELSLLKQQVNPHFFFNTLNNLYALSLTKDKQTPEVILQLSELMRYVIYKGKEEKAALAEEIKYIEDYIHLQQIRLHKKLDYQFEQEVADGHLQIPPLLFIILVENAFKHGVEPAERDSFLHLSLKSDKNSLLFTCENSVEENAANEKGIGLDNLRRRLALLFPGQHQLIVEKGQHTFKAMLKLALC